LNRGWSGIARVVDVIQKNWIEGGIGESRDRLRDAGASCLDGYIIILFKVDSGVLLGRIIRFTEELLLEAGVTRTNDVLGVFPVSQTGLVTITSSSGVMFFGGTSPAISRCWTVASTSPSIVYTSMCNRSAVASSGASIIAEPASRVATFVATANTWSRRAGVVPAVPSWNDRS